MSVSISGSGMRVYRFAWGNNPKRRTMLGRLCQIIARGRLNSALVEFTDGQREVVSRHSLRRSR